jgi:hypothetical protein
LTIRHGHVDDREDRMYWALFDCIDRLYNAA